MVPSFRSYETHNFLLTSLAYKKLHRLGFFSIKELPQRMYSTCISTQSIENTMGNMTHNYKPWQYPKHPALPHCQAAFKQTKGWSIGFAHLFGICFWVEVTTSWAARRKKTEGKFWCVFCSIVSVSYFSIISCVSAMYLPNVCWYSSVHQAVAPWNQLFRTWK